MPNISSLNITFEKNTLLPVLFGEHNGNLTHLEKKLNIEIITRGNEVSLSGKQNNIKKAEKVLSTLWNDVQAGHDISTADIDAALRFLEDKTMTDVQTAIQTKKKTIAPRSPNQAKYIQSIKTHPLVFGLGPAGTGKTYLAVAAGVSMYISGQVERLIFCRPAVEAGENLGFLPGDMKEKVDPYLRPIYDALQDMLPWDFMTKKMDAGEIEVAPLAFMRGRTLSHAFVILDEAQNTTPSQMKMFLTRMGESSHMVINGDPTQTDIPHGTKSGLADATEKLKNIDDIAFTHFEQKDIIRHPLVGKIVAAYDTNT